MKLKINKEFVQLINLKYFYILIILLLLFNCKNKSNSNKIINIFYNNNILKIEKEVLIKGKDTINDGYLKEYFETGIIKLIKYYKNGKLHGLEKSYFENGKIENIGYYNDGKQDSIWIWYNPIGIIAAKDYWCNGKPFGSQFKFDSFGKINKYLFYSLDGLIYKWEINNRKEILESGTCFFAHYNKNKVTKNELFETVFYFATPPSKYFKFKLSLIKADCNKSIEEKEVSKNDFIKNPYSMTFYFSKKFSLTGKYKLYSIAEYNDSLSDRIKRDTILLNIEVVK